VCVLRNNLAPKHKTEQPVRNTCLWVSWDCFRIFEGAAVTIKKVGRTCCALVTIRAGPSPAAVAAAPTCPSPEALSQPDMLFGTVLTIESLSLLLQRLQGSLS
jgi:hypothetical protein